jgi:hypothetical protein
MLAVGCALLGILGCGNPAQKTAEKLAEKSIEKSTGGKAKVDLGTNVDISDLPEMLRYPGAKAAARWSVSQQEGKGMSYVLMTGDPADKVVQHYKQTLAGWKEGMTMQGEKGTVMAFSRNDEKQSVLVTVGLDTEKAQTSIGLIVVEK